MDSNFVLYALLELLTRLPMLLMEIGGIAVALATWRRHPRISLYTTVSLLISLILQVLTTFIYRWLPVYLYGEGRLSATNQVAYVFAAIGFVTALISAAALGLLLLAIFSERGGASENRDER